MPGQFQQLKAAGLDEQLEGAWGEVAKCAERESALRADADETAGTVAELTSKLQAVEVWLTTGPVVSAACIFALRFTRCAFAPVAIQSCCPRSTCPYHRQLACYLKSNIPSTRLHSWSFPLCLTP